MCNDGSNDTTVQAVASGIADVQDHLKNAIDTMIAVDRMFSAYDITVLARQTSGIELGRHKNVLRHMIHDLLDPLPDDYEKTFVTLTNGSKTFLYHPDNKNTSEYHLCPDTVDTDEVDVNEVVSSVPQKPLNTTASARMSVPKGLIDQIGLKTGDTAYLLPIVSGADDGVEILCHAPIQNMSTANIDQEGRLRLRVSRLKNYGLTGPDYDISLGLNGKSILIKNIKKDDKMITKKNCLETCPKCGATLKDNKLYYGVSAMLDEGLYYPVTCLGCGLKYREYYDVVFSSTEYEDESLEFENPYSLFSSYSMETIEANKNKRAVKRAEEDLRTAKMVTKEITEILTILVEDISEAKMREASSSINKLDKYKVGVGDTATDESISYKFDEMRIAKYGTGQREEWDVDTNDFYGILHFGE